MASVGTAPGTIGVWLAAARPATLLAALCPVLVGTALAAARGRHDLVAAAAALAGAVFIQIGTNLYNDYGDFVRGADDEHRIGPPRAVARGWLSPRQVVAGAAASFAVAAVVGIYLCARGGLPIVVIGAASIASGILYTGGPRPLAYVGLGDLFVLLFFGVVAVCGTYWVQARELDAGVVAMSAAVGGLATAILVVNNLRDRQGDARAGKRTLVVRFGPRLARLEIYGLWLMAYAIPVALWAAGSIGAWGGLLPLASAPLAAREGVAIFRRDGADLDPHLGGVARLGLVYASLFSLGVLL